MTVVGIISDDYYPDEDRWGGTGWARIAKYLPLMPDHLEFHVATQVWPATDNGLSITSRETGKRVYPDVLWCQRVAMPHFQMHALMARQAGQRVVTDLDDLLWEVPPESLADRVWDTQMRAQFVDNLRTSDTVICSTPFLAREVDRIIGATGHRVGIHVVKNTVDVDAFTPVYQDTFNPVLGWAGCPAVRPADLELLRGSLPLFRHADPSYRIQHSGHIEAWPSFYDYTGVEPDILVPSVHPQDYPDVLTFHVGMIPLDDSRFNDAKSDIKGIEYAAAGIPFVASPSAPYKQLKADWGPRLVTLAATAYDWDEHLSWWLRNRPRRIEAGASLREKARTRDISTAVPTLSQILQS